MRFSLFHGKKKNISLFKFLLLSLHAFLLYHRLDGHEFEQALWDGDGQESVVCCSPWGHKELDKTYWPDNNQQHTQLITSSALNSPLIYNWPILSSLDPGVLCLGMGLFAFILRDSEFFHPGNSRPLVLKMFIYWWFPPLRFHFLFLEFLLLTIHLLNWFSYFLIFSLYSLSIS